MTIYTIGHSTRSIEEFIALLTPHDITRVVDVRTIPKSRRNPQFAGEALATSLLERGIAYTWMKELGGLRRPSKDSPNAAWRNDSFRGYADYMQTPAFAAAIDELLKLATDDRVAIMCSEAVPWRCHRSLIGDALLARGVGVLDIMSEAKATEHRFTPFAKVEGKDVTYPVDVGSVDPT